MGHLCEVLHLPDLDKFLRALSFSKKSGCLVCVKLVARREVRLGQFRKEASKRLRRKASIGFVGRFRRAFTSECSAKGHKFAQVVRKVLRNMPDASRLLYLPAENNFFAVSYLSDPPCCYHPSYADIREVS